MARCARELSDDEFDRSRLMDRLERWLGELRR
jgi:hypothetical protein